MEIVKDFLGNEINIDDYFAYPLIIGRSANMAVFQFKGTTPSGKYRGRPVKRAYDTWNAPLKYQIWKGGEYRDMTVEERAAADAKTTTLNLLHERAILLTNFKETSNEE